MMLASFLTAVGRFLSLAGQFFAAVHVVRVPLAIAVIGAVALILPSQIEEVYRVIAQDLRFAYEIRCRASFFSITCPHFAILREVGIAYIAVLGAAWAIWHSGTRLASIALQQKQITAVEQAVLRWSPTVMAVGLLLAAAWGVKSSIPFDPNGKDARMLDAIAEHKAIARWGAEVTPQKIASMRELIADFTLPADIMIWMALLLAWIALLLTVIAAYTIPAVPRQGRSSCRSVAERLEKYGPVLAFVVFAIALGQIPVSIPQWIGPIGILGLFLTCATLAFSPLSATSSRYGVPFIFLLGCWVFLLSWLGWSNNHVVNVEAVVTPPGEASTGNKSDFRKVLTDWHQSRPDRERYEQKNERYPVYIVAAQGGGIYAAYHASRLLGSLQDRCSAFAFHTFAISGVSGGSVGASVFVSLLKQQQGVKPEPCKPGSVTNRDLLKEENSLAAESSRILDQDLLSPLLSGFLFSDALQTVIPTPFPQLDRARLLERSLERAFDNPTDIAKGGPVPRLTKRDNPLTLAYSTHWDTNAGWPALVLNTTDVRSGQRRLMAPFDFGKDTDKVLPVRPGGALAGVKLSTAAFLSARFPWVTPSAWFKDASGGLTYLVDGGYYDNSGLATALELMREIEKADVNKKLIARLIIITGVPDPAEPVVGFNETLDPIRAMLNSWGIRPFEAIEMANADLNNSADVLKRVHIVRLRGLLYHLPLGWRLSGGTAYAIDAEDPVSGLCRGAANERPLQRLFDADCLLKDLEVELL
jgi:hypothetical protein